MAKRGTRKPKTRVPRSLPARVRYYERKVSRTKVANRNTLEYFKLRAYLAETREKLTYKRIRDRERAALKRVELRKDPRNWTARKLHRWYPEASPDALLALWSRELNKLGLDPRSNRTTKSDDGESDDSDDGESDDSDDGESDDSDDSWYKYISDELSVSEHDVFDAWLSPEV